MSYNVKINGNSYALPVKNIAVMKQLKRFAEIPQLYAGEKISIEEIVNEHYEFLSKSIGEEAAESLLGTDIENTDVDLLTFAVNDIVEAYTKDSIKKQIQSETAQIKMMMADKDVAKVVDVVSKRK